MSINMLLQPENTASAFTAEDWHNTPAPVQKAFQLLLNRVIDLGKRSGNPLNAYQK